MRLIDADALMRTICGLSCGCEPNECGYLDEYRKERCRAGQYVEKMPTVDAVPVVHGRWELVDAAEPQRYGCSKCSCLSWYGTYRYCPNCGAKMDGDADEKSPKD